MEYFTGAVNDPRPIQEQANVFKHEELGLALGVYDWKTKPRETWRSFPIRDQNGSGMCGAFAGAKALGINNWYETGNFVNLNTAYIYNKRTTNGAGMWLQELLSILCKYGAPLDPTLKSDKLNEEQANAMNKFSVDEINEALKYKGLKYFEMTEPNIDAVALLIDSGITPILLLRCNFKEWTNDPFFDPTVRPWTDYNVHHFVPAVDATLIDGKKRIIIEDSWGQQYGHKGVRAITEDFFKNRIYAVGYVIDLKIEDTDKPKHTFFMPLVYGTKGEEVKAWQKVLQYEKFLVTHTADGKPLPLGSYLEMTAKATKDWQLAHGIMDYANEKNLKKIRMGEKTMKAANQIYA